MTLYSPSDHSATGGSGDDPNRANRGHVLGGSVTWGRLHFHLELPGCDLTFRHVHAHSYSTRSRAHGWPSLAETIKIVESLGVSFAEAGPPYQPVCGHSEGWGVRVLDDCHPKRGVWWACKACLEEPPNFESGTLPGGGS